MKLDLMQDTQRYSQADPFPHTVIDGLWPDELLNEILQEWPDLEDSSWRKVGPDFETKYRNDNPDTFPPSFQRFFSHMDSPEFIEQLEKLSGYSGLMRNPECDLLCGMHVEVPGGFLATHTDPLWSEGCQCYRVMNVLVYLNPDWTEGDGGELVLWSAPEGTDKHVDLQEVASVPPLFNRTVIMNCNEDTWHQVKPVQNHDRRGIATWFYLAESPGPRNTKADSRWPIV